ncbi:E3 ubiquitin ligase [Halostella sp. JP-L12]|uniref:GIDE domain-containing protein n=1 Tax=Halostella TaxID=1843185 RepID=UPI000EF7693A|nr:MULTISPECIES: GIDE domain-containing protein [Halostella]NHN47118.1 E3 ubiquitin ligase [Halostella sp. JP-L12]
MYRNEPVDVASAANASGVVEVEGTVEPHEVTLVSPFTGTECVACRYEVEEYTSYGKSSHWDSIYSGGARRPFVLADDTGRLLVEPTGASLALDEDDVVRVDAGDRPPERIRRWIGETPEVDSEEGSWDLGPLSIATGNDRKYVERRLDPGETVHVYGVTEFRRWSDAGGTVNAVVRGEGAPFFRITDGSEREAVRRLATPALYRLAAAAVCAVAVTYAGIAL